MSSFSIFLLFLIDWMSKRTLINWFIVKNQRKMGQNWIFYYIRCIFKSFEKDFQSINWMND